MGEPFQWLRKKSNSQCSCGKGSIVEARPKGAVTARVMMCSNCGKIHSIKDKNEEAVKNG